MNIEQQTEAKKEQRRNYYREHREERLKYGLNYYRQNREERMNYALKYYHQNKEQCDASARYRDKRTIKHNGKAIVRNVNKPPKPMLCTLCSRHSHLVFHHWEDIKPEVGLWICNKCHSAIHRMIKIGLLKASVESQSIIKCIKKSACNNAG